MEIQTLNPIEFLKSRKSVRNFKFKKLTQQVIREILECGRWAPSHNNCQPWRVHIITHPTVKLMLAELSPDYQDIYETAYCCLVVFLDLERSNDRFMDILAMGAFMENLLLGVHAIPKIGAVWLSKILGKKEEVNEIFKLSPKKYELIGIIAFGAIDEEIEQFKDKKKRERRPIDDFIEWY